MGYFTGSVQTEVIQQGSCVPLSVCEAVSCAAVLQFYESIGLNLANSIK